MEHKLGTRQNRSLLKVKEWSAQERQKAALLLSEQMAENGDVDGSMAQAQVAERFSQEHDTLHKTLTTPERTMTVCEVCGVFINSTDNEQRKADHLEGEQCNLDIEERLPLQGSLVEGQI